MSKKALFKRHALTTAISLLSISSVPLSFAQGGEDDLDISMLEEVIVTGVARQTSVMETSVSVSSISSDEILDNGPRTTAEIFRNIPGIRSESSSGEGNANINIRGLPSPDGGSRYLLIHEDGLPVMMFGDSPFANADGFLRADSTLQSVESVRGGSASVLASNSPGGMLNFISKNGEEEGGSVSVTTGLDFYQLRTDFEYGGEISDGLRFHVGGFFREGEGPRDAFDNANSGGQIKFNVTKEFDSGFARLTYKRLDDRTIMYLPGPATNEGDGIGGFDPANETLHSGLISTIDSINANGDLVSNDVRDGQHVMVEAWGGEFEFDLGEGWTVNNKVRLQEISGTWTGPFLSGFREISGTSAATQAAEVAPADLAGTSQTAGLGADFVYANGPNQGQTFRGTAAEVIFFNVDVNDAGNFFNDFRLSKNFDDNGSLTLGLFAGRQSSSQDWNWSRYLQTATGSDDALIDVVDSSGAAVTDNGLVAYGQAAWGGCCTKQYNLDYSILAPYADFDWTFDTVSVNLGVRLDTGSASGTNYNPAVRDVGDVNRDGVVSYAEANAEVVDRNLRTDLNYDWSELSFSGGVNVAITDDVAVFGRYSQGVRVNAERLVPGAIIGGDVPDEQLVDEVDQLEVGVKWAGSNFDLFATLFTNETTITSYDPTQNPPELDQEYESTGLEVEAEFDITDNIYLNGSFTWIDAEITADAVTPTNVGTVPRRQADLIYNFTIGWETDVLSLGTNIVGTTDAPDNFGSDVDMEGFTTFGLFGNYNITEAFMLSLNVNNLFDEAGVTEQGGGGYRTITGRSSTLRATFTF